ncbi:nucleotidyl transferase AbiEii/AbiGii toxin family protein [Candidatus Woesearchaeota archaeon]|nr:nucleotidyl transferase AbiEii/AbiGii toxin family protein [Candidatus Woesearchaeota archaeon]
MDLLQLREKEIFETLKRITHLKFVVIGGYAASAYALPRFSIDCDIVVEDSSELNKIEGELRNFNYVKKDANKISTPYDGKFIRYEKELENNLNASIDILFKDILDRQTNATFSAKWVFENSSIKPFKGKTITEELKLRIMNPDALIVMKAISCRSADIRDVFMLITKSKDKVWIKEEIEKRCSFKERFAKIKEKINSKQFKDNLQGVYGHIDEELFKKHKQQVLELNFD